MQIVSDAWKAAHEERLLGTNFIEITIEVGDPDSAADAAASSDSEAAFANTDAVTKGIETDIPKYATFEHNQWLLDGNAAILPSGEPEDTGYISGVISSADGSFAVPQTIAISFSRVFDKLIPGVTITWSEEFGEYAVDFKITAYNGAEVVASTAVTGNRGVESAIELDIIGYNRIEIAVTKWCLPNRRVRASQVFCGLRKSYEKRDIMSYNNSRRIYPLGDGLPNYSIEFEVNNIDGAYDPNNPQGFTKYLMTRQAVYVRYGMRVGSGTEWISGGKYYLNEWKSPQNGITASFKARDAMEYLSDIYYKGTYSASSVTLYALAEAVMADAVLPLNKDGTSPWRFDESLKNVSTTAPLPVATIAECLQLIANAASCVLSIGRDGAVEIAPASGEHTDYGVTAFNSYSRPELELSRQLKTVEVGITGYYKGSSIELFNGIVPVDGTQDVIIEYSEKAVSVSATVTGGTLVSAEYYTGACKLKITASGDVTVVVKGTQLKSSASTYSLTASGEGETERLDNPLITNPNAAKAAAAYIRDYLTNRRTFTMDWRADTRLDVGDIIQIENKYGAEAAMVTEFKLNFGGAFRGSGKARAVT